MLQIFVNFQRGGGEMWLLSNRVNSLIKRSIRKAFPKRYWCERESALPKIINKKTRAFLKIMPYDPLRTHDPMRCQEPIGRTQDPNLYQDLGPKNLVPSWEDSGPYEDPRSRILLSWPRIQGDTMTQDSRTIQGVGPRTLGAMMIQDHGTYGEDPRSRAR